MSTCEQSASPDQEMVDVEAFLKRFARKRSQPQRRNTQCPQCGGLDVQLKHSWIDWKFPIPKGRSHEEWSESCPACHWEERIPFEKNA